MANRRHTLRLYNALLVAAIGFVVMAGWIFRIPVWQWIFTDDPMVFNAALCMSAGGVALLALQRESPAGDRLGRSLGCIIAVLSAVVLAENVSDTDFGVDWPALHAWLPALNPPGRMEPSSAFALLVVGVTLALPPSGSIYRRIRCALGAIVLTIAVLHLVARNFLGEMAAFDAASTVSWVQVPLMSALTGGGIALLGAGLLFHESARSGSDDEPSDRRVYASLGAAFAALLTLAAVSYGSVKEMQARLLWVDQNIQMRIAIEEFTDEYDIVRSTWWQYLVQRRADDFTRMETAIDELRAQFDTLNRLGMQDPKQYQQLLQLRKVLDAHVKAMLAHMEHRRLRETDDTAIGQLVREQSMNPRELLGPLRKIRLQESALLRERQAVSRTSMQRATNILLIGNGIAFAILAAAFGALLYMQDQRSRLAWRLRVANENLEAGIQQRTQDLRTANAELESLNATLEHRVAERTADLEDFSYSVSHDLRAPLRAIDGYSLMLQEDHGTVLDSEGKRLIEQVRGYVQRMGTLIDDLLRLSRLGRQSLSCVQLNMSGMVTDVWRDVLRDDPYAAASSPELQLRPLPETYGDPALLRQVWINLLSNAVKYSSRAAHPTVVIDGRIEGGAAIYSIADNGAGFDMAHAGKLFGVFQRLHSYEEFSGTGVGLAIVNRIVKRHGGRVWADSAINSGATFYFSLPLAGEVHERY